MVAAAARVDPQELLAAEGDVVAPEADLSVVRDGWLADLGGSRDLWLRKLAEFQQPITKHPYAHDREE